MKLYGMQTAFTASLNSKLHGHLMADELLAHLVESEWLDREKRKTERYIRSAHSRYQASIEEIDYTTSRGLDKNQLMHLFDCSFIDKKPVHHRMMLMEITEDPYGKHATLIASQLPQEKWYGLFDDHTVADALLDRLVHNAHKIVIKGESMRKLQRPVSINE